jgi:DNA recombination protein RmuC
MTVAEITILVALGGNLLLLAVCLMRLGRLDLRGFAARLEAAEKAQDRTMREIRELLSEGREESSRQGRDLRQELGASLRGMADSNQQVLLSLANTQKVEFDGLAGMLGRFSEQGHENARVLREEITTSVKGLSDSNERRLEALRLVVDTKLQGIREDNTKQLEQMRQTVDEKLHGVLEQRLGESFRLVSDRLEQVQKGLGEMQNLATGVGDLKRVLTNVKVRGTWGEVQLASLLEQVLTPEQYAANVATKENSGERVEFAIKFPGRAENGGEVVWIPIDAKFPQEDYQLLTEAQERGDLISLEAASKRLELRIKAGAKAISEKYLNPPVTTDFAIMFLPTEGLYAEVIRRPGLADTLQREHRVIVAGPTNLWALLNALQMGFRTLAIQKRSSEVWQVLGAVKTEFSKFGGMIKKVQKKLHEASNVVEEAATRSRMVERKLRNVQELPSGDAARLLLGSGSAPIELPIEDKGQEVLLLEA